MLRDGANSPHLSARKVCAILALMASVAVPLLLARLLCPSPRTRDIHIDAFRYGFDPARIVVNRGDLLRLTFSTRDTGQSFFLQDYDLHVSITPGSRVVEVYRISQPDSPAVRTETVEFEAGMPGLLGRLASKSQFRNHTYNGPLHGTERGELIVGPNYLLAAGLGLLCGIPIAALILSGRTFRPGTASQPVDLFRVFPLLKRLARKSCFQFQLMIPMLAVFYFIVLAGLVGTKVSGRNAGPMITWILWLSALILVLVPLGGRIWCLACPLPTLGEWLQRRRMQKQGGTLTAVRVFGRPFVWPDWLRNSWPSVFMFLLLGTFSTTLVALPPATSWLLIGLVLLATSTSVFPDQRLFCRHLCPINSYISLYSMTGRVAARSVDPAVCSQCTERFCLTGSVKGWGCPYGLCMGEVDRNYSCGMCTECVKTCAYDNVSVFWRSTGWDRRLSGNAEAFQSIVMFSLAVIYCVVNLGPWERLRNWIDLVDRVNWSSFWGYAACVWALSLVAAPGLYFALSAVGVRLSRSSLPAAAMFQSSSAALIPLGLSIWMCFALAMLSSMMTFVLQSLSDPFNWGWDLLRRGGSPWHIIMAPAIPWLQVGCVIAGTVYSLRTLLLCWHEHVADAQRARLAAVPAACFLLVAAGGMITFFAA